MREQEKTTVGFGDFRRRENPISSASARGNDFASLQASGMDERKRERKRGVLRETEEMGRRERRVLNFFCTAGSFQARVLKFFKGKLVFLTFRELSIFEPLD